MKHINPDNLPHIVDCAIRMMSAASHTWRAWMNASWWGICLGPHCRFTGRSRFRRHPGSRITIGAGCRFNSSPASNLIGVNRPCIISTLREGAEIEIGRNCGFSGTVIACAKRIKLGENIRCGANTLITDTDWHTDDPRTGPDAPVIICDNVWLGVGVTVLKGVTIGENTVVGAGSIVTRPLPAGVIAAGVPAKVIRAIGTPS